MILPFKFVFIDELRVENGELRIVVFADANGF